MRSLSLPFLLFLLIGCVHDVYDGPPPRAYTCQCSFSCAGYSDRSVPDVACMTAGQAEDAGPGMERSCLDQISPQCKPDPSAPPACSCSCSPGDRWGLVCEGSGM